MNTRTVSTTEARKNIFTLTEKVQVGGVHYTLTEKGKAKAVLMSSDEYESWKETLEVLTDVPDIQSRLSRAKSDARAGRVRPLEAIAPTYDIHSAPRPRGRKGSR